jgi:hypothetical protein
LRFACGNIYLIVFTGFEVIKVIKFTRIDINCEFWSPSLKSLDEFPGIDINTRSASSNAYDIGFGVLSSNEGRTVGKSGGNEENAKLHYYY